MIRFLYIIIPCLLDAQITLKDHNKAAAASANGTATTPALNCTGGNFLNACVTTYTKNCTTATVSDSLNGTWTLKSSNYSSSSSTMSNSCLWWKENASVNGSQTISATVTGGYAEVNGACFSGVLTSSSKDQEAGSGNNSTGSIQFGSITPSTANELTIGCFGKVSTAGSISVSGATLLDALAGSGSNGQATGSSYTIQTTTTAFNPTWDQSSLSGLGAGGGLNVSFKQAGSAVIFTANPSVITVGP